jgi:activator of HSP90 ATPase
MIAVMLRGIPSRAEASAWTRSRTMKAQLIKYEVVESEVIDPLYVMVKDYKLVDKLAE